MVGSIRYIVSLSSIAWAFISYGDHFTEAGSLIVLGSVFLFITSHAFGQGSVIWVTLAKYFQIESEAVASHSEQRLIGSQRQLFPGFSP